MNCKILLTLILSLGIVLPLAGQDPPKQPEPLSPDEIREGTLRIEQAILGWEAEKLLREALKREQDYAAKERDLAARELETEKAKTALAEKESALQKDRADFYEQAFKQATKGRSTGCKILKIFTLGLGKCA